MMNSGKRERKIDVIQKSEMTKFGDVNTHSEGGGGSSSSSLQGTHYYKRHKHTQSHTFYRCTMCVILHIHTIGTHIE